MAKFGKRDVPAQIVVDVEQFHDMAEKTREMTEALREVLRQVELATKEANKAADKLQKLQRQGPVIRNRG